MSETLAAPVLEAEEQISESYNAVGKNIDSDPLTSVISAEPTKLVICPWLGNTVVTISEASLAYSANVALITEENIHIVAAIMAGLEAYEPKEPDEEAKAEEVPEQTKEANQKSNYKTEAKQEQKNLNPDRGEKQPEKVIASSKHLEKPAEIKSGKKPSTEPIVAKSPKSTDISEAKTEKDISPLGAETQTPKIERPAKTAPAEQAAIKNYPAPSEAATNLTPPISEKKIASPADQAQAPIIEVDKPSSRPDIVKIPAAPKIETAREASPHTIEPPAEPRAEKTIEPVADMEAVEPETFESSATDPELFSLHDDIAERVAPGISIEAISDIEIPESPIGIEPNWVVERAETDDNTIELPEVITLDAFEPVTFFERQTADTFEETYIEPNLLPVLEMAVEPFDQEEPIAMAPEQADKTQLVIEETEEVFMQMAETIQQSSPEIVEAVNDILDKIIEAPAKLGEQTAEAMPIETEVKEELDELFTELFDTAGIDYTPDLIETLVHLTVEWNLADEIKKIKKAEPDKTKDRGTHEIIKKFLAAVSTIKKAMANAGTIGRSALRLYSFNAAV